MPKINPTAQVHAGAKIAQDTEIGPWCVVEDNVTIGSGTVLRENVIVRQYTTMGVNNYVDAYSVLGGAPQDFKFQPSTKSFLQIGDGNVFREHVTINRATGEGNSTIIGNRNFWMTGCHAGHNAIVEDDSVMVNRSALGGYALLSSKAFLSAHVGVHQFCWVGTMAMSQANCITTSHVPPYCMFAGVNEIVGLNKVGLRRAQHISAEDRKQVKDAFSLLYRSCLTPRAALEKMDACTDWGAAADEFRKFIRKVINAKPPFNRSLSRFRMRHISDID